MVSLTEAAAELKENLENTFADAYAALRTANIVCGVISDDVQQIPEDNGIELNFRSVMGVELPTVSHENKKPALCYSLTETNSRFDMAYISFAKAKDMSIKLAEIENSIYRLSVAIRKTQKRANALKNIVIPTYREQVKFITSALEEKEREEFSRQKIIKAAKLKKG